MAGSGTTATIIAVAAGSVTISATSDGVTGSSGPITVAPRPNARTNVAVTPTSVTLLGPGATQVITTTAATGSGAMVGYASSSSDPAVATVAATGANPVITAVGVGAPTISSVARTAAEILVSYCP